jgi:tetratricopeptide (TPR) repeat protein
MSVQKLLSFTEHYNHKIEHAAFGYAKPAIQATQIPDSLVLSPAASELSEAKKYKELGNQKASQNDYKGAIDYYKKSTEIKPDFVDAYYNLGKAYKTINDTDNAIKSFSRYLELEPQNIEIMANLGQCLKEKKQYNQAENYFKKVLEIDPKFDMASRELKETENLRLELASPKYAQMRKFEQSRKNLNDSLALVKKYYPPQVMKELGNVSFSFDKTSALSGHSNIAQYENYNNKIIVTDKYTWAAPEVVAAYMVHEVIHGKDRDPYTSVKEEQDAYEESVKFWKNFNNGIKDPEMDYALDLYNQSPTDLANKVAEIYTTRDDSIPKYSPNHGIAAKSLALGWFKTKKMFSKVINVPNKATEFAIISDNKLYERHYR